jgi:hypothetical protein
MLSKKIIALFLFTSAPILAFAANDVQINNPTNFDILKADNSAPSTVVTGSSGQVANFDVHSNYIDITLDNFSSVTFNTITSLTFIKITKESGSNSYSINPACPTTTASLSGSGATVVLRLETFSTNTCTSTSTPPAPPSGGGAGGIIFNPTILNFHATQSSNNAILSWNNPNDINFSSVKILRSSTFYPINPTDGVLVYQGAGTSAIDFNLNYDQNYYYSAFSYNKGGNVSNAVITQIYLINPHNVSTTTLPVYPIYPGVIGGGTSTSTVGISNGTTTTIGFDINYIIHSQNGQQLGISSSTVTFEGSKNLLITADTSKFPVPIKTFILRITDPSDPNIVYSYMFGADMAGKFFQVNVPIFSSSGKYPFTITAYNSNNKAVSMTRGSFNVQISKAFQYIVLTLLVVLILLLSIFLVVWLSFREHSKRQREKTLDTYKGF